MTPQYILKADLSREPHCGPYTREQRIAEIEDMQWASECVDNITANATKGVLIANWNYFSRKAVELLESYGYDTFWSDETSLCDGCYKAIYTTARYYGDTPSYAVMECEILCSECLQNDAATYLESLEDCPERACNIRGINLAEYGYVKVEGDFESGFHPGQTDDPATIYKRLRDTYERLLFVVDGAGQFDIRFSVWRHAGL